MQCVHSMADRQVHHYKELPTVYRKKWRAGFQSQCHTQGLDSILGGRGGISSRAQRYLSSYQPFVENPCKSPVLQGWWAAVGLEVWRWVALPDWGASRGRAKRQFRVMSTGCSNLSLVSKERMEETEGDSWAFGVSEQRQIKTIRSGLDVEKMHGTHGSHLEAVCRDQFCVSL